MKTHVLAFLVASTATVASLPAQQTAATAIPAVPLDPIGAVADAARMYPIIAMGEGQHWNEQGHRFRLDLIRDPRFSVIDDIVVEFGNSRYQDLINRWVGGRNVTYVTLRQVWQNTTAPNAVWDVPIYEELFNAVRYANASRPKNRQLRVLLADPPVNWDSVRTKDDVLKWMAGRDTFAAALVEKEVLAKGRRALLIFGDGHVWRRGEEPNLVGMLDARAPNSTFVIATPTSADLREFQADVASWRVPSIARVRGSVLGAVPFSSYYRPGGRSTEGVDPAQWRSVRMEDQADAVLYLGLPKTITLSQLTPRICSDSSYLRMRFGRLAIIPWGQPEVARIKRVCGSTG